MMKYELLENIFSLWRTNGRFIKLDHVKCGRGTRYEIKIKDEDDKEYSMLMTKDEVIRLCQRIKSLMMDVSTNLEIELEPIALLDDVDISEIVAEYSNFFNDRTRIVSLIADFTPEMILEKNLLINVYDSGILKNLTKSTHLGTKEIAQYTNLLCNLYGIKEGCALWAIRTWAYAFQIPCDVDKYINDINSKKSAVSVSQLTENDTSQLSKQQSNLHEESICYHPLDVVIDNSEIQIIYESNRDLNLFMGGPVKELYFLVENKTNKELIIRFPERKVCGYVDADPWGEFSKSSIPAESNKKITLTIYKSSIPEKYKGFDRIEASIKYEAQDNSISNTSTLLTFSV